MDPIGFWTEWGAPSSVDWCESNYVASPYVAEWWNTLSSFAISAMGVVGIRQARRTDPELEPRFVLLFAALVFVGVASAGFHATLLRASQALDELPMFYAITIACYAFRFRSEPRVAPGARSDAKQRLFRAGAVAVAAFFTLAYFAFPVHVLFIAAYVVLLLYLASGTLRLALSASSSPAFRRLCLLTLGLNLFAGVGLWLPEHVWLSCSHPLQSLKLHAVFHLFAGLGTYAWIFALIVDRRAQRGAAAPWAA